MLREKRALILIDHGSKVDEANELLLKIKEKLLKHPDSKFDVVEYCHMELASPTLEEAFRSCVNSGAGEIIVHPYFLAPGRHSKTDIPGMVSAVSSEFPGVNCKITEPLGLHDKIIEVIIERSNSPC